MSAATLKPLRPGNRPQPLATVVTWVFWVAVVATAATVIRTLTGQGFLLGAHIGGPSPSLSGICQNAAPALLPHASSGLGLAGLSPGVHAIWATATLCAAWIGLGLIAFARIMRVGAGMRADLEGTV